MDTKIIAVSLAILLTVLAGLYLYGTPPENATVNPGNTVEDTDEKKIWFEDTAQELGFEYLNEETSPREGVDAAGVYVVDYGNNHQEDILAIGSEGPRLFRNEEGEFVKSDALPGFDLEDRGRTKSDPRDTQADVSEIERGFHTALFFDHDNSGYEDLYLLSNNESVFLENDGGEFRERDVGLDISYEGVRAASAADYTGNGCLDVFVVQAGDWTRERPEGYNDIGLSIEDDNGNENMLFRNDCGSFEEVTEDAGIQGEAWSLATSFVDLTNDGYPDIHVANDFNNDVIYLNNQDGTFERRVLPDFTNRNGMSSEVADVTGNGYLDIFVSNIYYPSEDGREGSKLGFGREMGNNLLLNQGNGEFVDGAEEYGVMRTGGFGWAALLADFDNTGSVDLYQSVLDNDMGTYPSFWLGNGTGEGFERLNAGEIGFERRASFGAASLDKDMDGTLDIATGNLDEDKFSLYGNRLEEGDFLQVVVEGSEDTPSVGSRVTVRVGDMEKLRVKNARSDYQSQDSRVLHFGLGDAEQVDEVKVEWPDGSVEDYQNVEVNQRVVISAEEGIRSAGA